MQRSLKAVLLAIALAAFAGACGRADGLTAPDAWQASESQPAPAGGEATTQDDAPPPPPPADTTGRWGGGLGSGT